jgi:hypothetical protein
VLFDDASKTSTRDAAASARVFASQSKVGKAMTQNLGGASIALLLIASSVPTSALACATCGCSLSTDAAMGYSTDTGWRASLEYDYINQNQLRTGSHAVSSAQVAGINDAGGDQEVEDETINRYTTFGLGYSPSADWNLRLLVPYVNRGHSTYGAATNPITSDQLSGSTITGLGDIRFITSYQGLLEQRNLGLQLGVKMPTGNYGGPNADGTGIVGRHPTAFSSGPISQNASPGNLVDTSLQPGTGSTDVIVGIYYHRAISDDFDAFVNGQFQAAVVHRLDQSGQDFRPGNTATTSLGVRYEAHPGLVPQFQLNIFHKAADQGALADNLDSAGTVAYLSPGVTVSVTGNLQAFGFVQVPIYSHLIGYQLAPRWTASAGLSYSF